MDGLVKFRALLTSGLLLLLLLTPSAWGQTDQERAGARSAAGEGIQAYQKGEYEKALRLLERAQSLVDAPTHLLFIARSRVKLGMLVEAREAYKKIITANLPDDAPKAFLSAQESAPIELAEIDARIAKLKVSVTAANESELSGLSVKVNGTPMAGALIGLSVPANPGKNEVVVSAEGMLTQTKSIELEEGQSDEMEFELQIDPNYSAATAEPPPTETTTEPTAEAEAPEETTPSNAKRTAGWVSLGIGGAAVATGAVFGVLSSSQLSKARDDETLCGSEKLCTPDGRNEVNAAKTKALVADISIGVGLAAVGVGTFLILSSKRDPQKVGVRSFSPSVGPQGGFVAIEGGF